MIGAIDDSVCRDICGSRNPADPEGTVCDHWKLNTYRWWDRPWRRTSDTGHQWENTSLFTVLDNNVKMNEGEKGERVPYMWWQQQWWGHSDPRHRARTEWQSSLFLAAVLSAPPPSALSWISPAGIKFHVRHVWSRAWQVYIELGLVPTSLASSGSPWLRAEYRIMYCVAPGAASQLTLSVLKDEGVTSRLAGLSGTGRKRMTGHDQHNITFSSQGFI